MDVLILLSYDKCVDFKAGEDYETHNAYVSGKEFRWIDWELYKRLKRRPQLRAIVGQKITI